MTDTRFCYDWDKEAFVPIIRDEAKEAVLLLVRIAQLHARIVHMREALNLLRSAKSGVAIAVDNNMLIPQVNDTPDYLAHLNTRVIYLRKALSSIRSAKAGAALSADTAALQRDSGL